VSDWYSGATRQDRIRDAIARNHLDLILALTPEQAGYLSGQTNFMATYWRLPGIYACAINGAGERAIVTTDSASDPQAKQNAPTFTYTSWLETIDARSTGDRQLPARTVAARPNLLSRPWQFDLDAVFDQIAAAVLSLSANPKRIGVDLEEVDTASLGRLLQRLPNTELVDATPVLDDLRTIKDPDEIAHLRLAGELTEIGMSGAVARIKIGMSATALNAAYQSAVHEAVIADAKYAAFRQAEGAVAIGFGVDSPHAVYPGQTIKFDMQVDIGGYHSDIGRTYAVAPTPDQVELYKSLHASLIELVAAVKPGTAFADVYAAGSGAMHRAGYTAFSRGHLGHSDGLTQHFEESPFIGPHEHRIVAPGMVLSVEMPYYVYGVGAFQMERMGVVTETGFDLIDRLPFAFALSL
jgi:Xaa-Pro dipeptidase